MKHIRINLNTKLNIKNIAIALGNFDGFHIGHIKLINELQRFKNLKKFNTAVLLFRVHSKNFIMNNNFKRLTSFDDKISILEKLDIDYVFSIDFDEILKNLSWIDFLDFLTNNINVNHIVVGEDYKFAKEREGNSNLIYNYMKDKNLSSSIVKSVECEGKKISSTDIISLISLGEIDLANKFLERFYSIRGIVKEGFKRGRSMNFPTANLSLLYDYVIPKDGVYFTKTIYENKEYFSFSSIGNNPTFNNKNSTIETHIFDFNEDIYNKEIKVSFIKRIRDNIKFNSVVDLIYQLNEDKKICYDLIKKYFKEK